MQRTKAMHFFISFLHIHYVLTAYVLSESNAFVHMVFYSKCIRYICSPIHFVTCILHICIRRMHTNIVHSVEFIFSFHFFFFFFSAYESTTTHYIIGNSFVYTIKWSNNNKLCMLQAICGECMECWNISLFLCTKTYSYVREEVYENCSMAFSKITSYFVDSVVSTQLKFWGMKCPHGDNSLTYHALIYGIDTYTLYCDVYNLSERFRGE